MRSCISITAILSITLVIAFPHTIPDIYAKNALIARTEQGGSGDRPEPAGPRLPTPEIVIQEAGGKLGAPQPIGQVAAKQPEYTLEADDSSNNVNLEDRSIITRQVSKEGTPYTEITFKRDLDGVASAEKSYSDANPGTQGRQFQPPGSSPRDDQREKVQKTLARSHMLLEVPSAAGEEKVQLNHDALRPIAVTVPFHQAIRLKNLVPEDAGNHLKVDTSIDPETMRPAGTRLGLFPESKPQSSDMDAVLALRPDSAHEEAPKDSIIEDAQTENSGSGKPQQRRRLRRDAQEVDTSEALDSQLRNRDVISTIKGGENTAVSGVTNTSADLSAQFQHCLAAYTGAQNNVSEALFPILSSLVSGSNSSLIYAAALSVFSHMTGSSPYIAGPFFYGLHSVEWIEDQAFGNGSVVNETLNAIFTTAEKNGTITQNSIRILEYFAVNKALLDIYYYAWINGTAAVNETGLLKDMATVGQYLLPADMSVAPAGYADWTVPDYDMSFFTAYNITGPVPDATVGNISFAGVPQSNGTSSHSTPR